MRKIKFFDTTLRDGEQSPGFSMKTEEKVALALQLERLGVDVIEAGFPIASPGDFDAVQKVAAVITKSSVAGLCRASTKDIQTAWDALKDAKKPRIHIFLATSDIHIEHKLRSTRERVITQAAEAVTFARSLCADVEFSAEDAMRTDPEYLCKVLEAVIAAGATTVNVPDTVGYIMPNEIYERIIFIKKNTKNIDKAVISVHCHNDLGLGVANTLAAVRAGADQVECTVNGIGERAGNSSLEEIIMALTVRKDYYQVETNINTKEIYRSSRMLSSITGIECQPNKAIVGKNAFAHESGIHQDGVLKNPFTYEIMTPESVGFPSNKLVLGKHSGRHAFATRLKDLGYELDKESIEILFTEFKLLADKKKEIFDEDLDALVSKKLFHDDKEEYTLDYVCFSSGNAHIPTATVKLTRADGTETTDASTGDGPVDAAFKAIERITGIPMRLAEYKLNAVTEGKDAQGEVVLSIEFDGHTMVSAKGYSTDILVASVNACMNALNRYMSRKHVKTH